LTEFIAALLDFLCGWVPVMEVMHPIAAVRPFPKSNFNKHPYY